MLVLALLLVATFGVLVSGRVRVEVVSLALIAVLGLSGLLSPAQALGGFASQATLAVAAMLALSAGLERTGVVEYLATFLARRAGRSLWRTLLALALPTALLSAFMNNTAIVALMIPVALRLARRGEQKPSKLLLPVSYFSILGGTCTLIGTSTNLLVDSLAREAGRPGFGMFEFTGLGVCYLLVGALYLALAGVRLLPERTGITDLLAVQAPGRFLTEVVLRPGSRYAGQPVGKVFAGSGEVQVLEVVRDEEPILGPTGDFVLRAGDVLYVESTAQRLTLLLADPEVERGTAVADDQRVPLDELLAGEMLPGANALFQEEAPQAAARTQVDLRMAEAVITPSSRFVGRAVRELGLSRRHGVQVLAIRRLGRQHLYKLRGLRLKAGDVLLLQGEPAALRGIHEEGDFLLMEGVERTLIFPRKAPLAIGILVGVVMLASANVAPLAFLALAGVAAMLVGRCMDVRDATRALDPGVLLLIAAMIPLGTAMEVTGMARGIADGVVALAGAAGPLVLVSAFYLLTSILTEFLSNNAAAVLLTPICLEIAGRMGMSPEPLLIAVMFGASASFATPIGYQTNTMVMGPGGYAFRDYLRVGVPLNLILWVAASLLIPVWWPV